ncbi:MAG: diaminopropionate ammonia-lyase, partial [Bacteroidota bacterium]
MASNAAKSHGWTLVQDTAWEGYTQIPEWIVSGYMTMFQELDNTPAADPDIVFLQAGVGSMAAAGIYHFLRPNGPERT